MAAFWRHPDPFELTFQRPQAFGFRLLFLFEARLLLFQPGGIVPLEGNPVAVIQLQDPAGHVVQEVPVMGHGDDRALVLLEVLLKPLDRFGVQMVRRLIQQEDIGFLDQQPAERDPALFPTGEDLDPCF